MENIICYFLYQHYFLTLYVIGAIITFIYDYLKKCGFDNVMLKEDEGERIFHFLDQKIHALQEKNTVIDIKTQQLKKLSLIKGEISYAENYIS